MFVSLNGKSGTEWQSMVTHACILPYMYTFNWDYQWPGWFLRNIDKAFIYPRPRWEFCIPQFPMAICTAIVYCYCVWTRHTLSHTPFDFCTVSVLYRGLDIEQNLNPNFLNKHESHETDYWYLIQTTSTINVHYSTVLYSIPV